MKALKFILSEAVLGYQCAAKDSRASIHAGSSDPTRLVGAVRRPIFKQTKLVPAVQTRVVQIVIFFRRKQFIMPES